MRVQVKFRFSKPDVLLVTVDFFYVNAVIIPEHPCESKHNFTHALVTKTGYCFVKKTKRQECSLKMFPHFLMKTVDKGKIMFLHVFATFIPM